MWEHIKSIQRERERDHQKPKTIHVRFAFCGCVALKMYHISNEYRKQNVNNDDKMFHRTENHSHTTITLHIKHV